MRGTCLYAQVHTRARLGSLECGVPRVREAKIERHLIAAVKARGGLCWKFTSPGTAGVPDRVVILPGRPAAFVEVKAPGETPRPAQVRRIGQLEDRGTAVFVLDDPTQVEVILDAI